MDPTMNIWYDKEGDFLEITFKQAKGYLKEISEDVYERVDEHGKLLGYAILNVSRHERHTLAIPLSIQQLA
jgi:uncharacterized protein YuzE